MPMVKTQTDTSTYALLVKMRKAEGLPSVSALFLKKCGVLADKDEANEIVQRGLKLAKRRTRGKEFRLRDLFDATEWERFSKGARLRAGRLFYEKVCAAVDGIRATRKSGSNQQMYVVA